jgi:hypothetical protein
MFVIGLTRFLGKIIIRRIKSPIEDSNRGFSIFFRCITFHPEGNCLFSGSHDSLKVHGWEPPKVHDMLVMGWGKIRDIAISSSQLVNKLLDGDFD